MSTKDTKLDSLVFNVLTKEQYEGLTEIDENQLYAVTDDNGDNNSSSKSDSSIPTIKATLNTSSSSGYTELVLEKEPTTPQYILHWVNDSGDIYVLMNLNVANGHNSYWGVLDTWLITKGTKTYFYSMETDVLVQEHTINDQLLEINPTIPSGITPTSLTSILTDKGYYSIENGTSTTSLEDTTLYKHSVSIALSEGNAYVNLSLISSEQESINTYAKLINAIGDGHMSSAKAISCSGFGKQLNYVELYIGIYTTDSIVYLSGVRVSSGSLIERQLNETNDIISDIVETF